MPVMVALLGFPLAMLLGMVSACLGARIRFARTSDAGEPAFRCKVRYPGYLDEPLLRWPARRTRARWRHDVLLVQRGLFVPRTAALAVHAPHRHIRRTCRLEVRGLGPDPMVYTLELDDRRTVEVAAGSADLTALAGPFLAAAIPGLPHPPREPRPHGR